MRIIKSPIADRGIEDWKAMVISAEKPAPRFFTKNQLMIALDRSRTVVHEILRREKAAGRCEMRLFRTMTGKAPIPHYRLKPNEKNSPTPKNPHHRRHR